MSESICQPREEGNDRGPSVGFFDPTPQKAVQAESFRRFYQEAHANGYDAGYAQRSQEDWRARWWMFFGGFFGAVLLMGGLMLFMRWMRGEPL